MRVFTEALPRALTGAARFLESWPGVVSMWLALLAYCYL